MIRLMIPALLLGSLLMPVGYVAAGVLAEGQVKNGYYWQKTSSSSGSVRYICRSISSGKSQKHQHCKDAGTVKPK